MANQKEYLIRFIEVIRDICSRGLPPVISYEKRGNIWTVIDETAVQGQVVIACKLQVIFIPGEISFEVSRMMTDRSKMIKHSGVIELDGEKQLDHISSYLEVLRKYGILD